MWFRSVRALDAAHRETLDLARDTITDLQRRLSESQLDLRRLTEALTERLNAPQPPAPAASNMSIFEDVMLPPQIQDEISLVATNGQMARHLEKWAQSEVNRKTPIATIIEMIRTGDEI